MTTRPPFVRTLLLLGACLALLASPRLEAKPKWYRMQTAHCEIYSCSSKEQTLAIAERLERFRFGLLEMTAMRQAYEPPILMLVFDDRRRMRSFLPSYKGETVKADAIFSDGPGEETIVMNTDGETDMTLRLVAHSYVYFLVNTRGLRLPTWLSEGLAEFFETMEVDNSVIELGACPKEYIHLLRREQFMPFSELFAIGRDSRIYNDLEQRQLFNAQSWALVHYWMCNADKDKTQRFLNFTNSLNGEVVVSKKAFEQALGMNFKSMGSTLEHYLRNGRFMLRTLKMEMPDIRGSITTQPVGDEERDMVFSFLRWRGNKSEDSSIELLSMAEKRPQDPRPYEFLAMIELSKEDQSYAQDYLHKAYERGSRKPWLLCLLASEVDDQLRQDLSLDYHMPEQLSAQMRAWLDESLAAAPLQSKALETLAMVEAFSKTPRIPVVNRLQKSIEFVVERRRFMLMLAIIHWRLNNEESAREILDLLIASSDSKSQAGSPSQNPRTERPSLPTLATDLLERMNAQAGNKEPAGSR
jgi:hypothetical protein